MKSWICSICGQSNKVFEVVLQGYPMGNIYVNSLAQTTEFLSDLQLSQCECGHVSALSDFSAEAIYNVDYAYLGDSAIPNLRRQYSLKLVMENLKGRIFRNLIDIGCGNFELLTLFSNRLQIESQVIGIDPVPKKIVDSKINFFNSFFEDTELEIEGDSSNPNLVCLDNVLEHIGNLEGFFQKLRNVLSFGDYVFVCVPSFELMVEGKNFEEFSHEHLQYFTLKSMNQVFLRHSFNAIASHSETVGTRGYNFHLYRYEKDAINQVNSTFNFQDDGLATEDFLRQFTIFKENLQKSIFSDVGQAWGVCASEITPTLSWFMGSSLSELEGIFDTTPSKQGKYMPGVSPKILPWIDLSNISKSSTIYITVPQLVPIVEPKLRELGFTKFLRISK